MVKKVFFNVIRRIIVFCLVLTMAWTIGGTENASAASKPGVPTKVIAKSGVYYDYINKHNIQGGDGFSLLVKWNKVANADGYRVKLFWNVEGDKHTETVMVTKNAGKYHYILATKYTYPHLPVKDVKSIVYGQEAKSMIWKKLQFCVSGGSSETVDKISIRSFKVRNGKKVYSKAKVCKVVE